MRNHNVDVLIGLPGSGKSTYTKQRLKEGYVAINKDQVIYMCHGGTYDFREEMRATYDDMFLELIHEGTRHGLDLVVDDVNLTVNMRKRILWHIPKPYTVTAVFWQPNPELNISNRGQEARGYTIERWREIITGMREQLEIPTAREGFDEIKFLEVYPKGTPEHP